MTEVKELKELKEEKLIILENFKTTYQRIELVFDDCVFTFNPCKLIYSRHPIEINRQYIAIIYQLEYLNFFNRERIIAEIPYYLSDGQTNEFRANMIFPFSCFNVINSQTCPFVQNEYILAVGGLLKYHIGKNIDVGLIQNEIYEYVNNHIDEKFKDESSNLFCKSILNEISMKTTKGLGSVLGRIENVLDFYIALASLDKNYSKRRHRPILGENQSNKYDLKYNDEEDAFLYHYRTRMFGKIEDRIKASYENKTNYHVYIKDLYRHILHTALVTEFNILRKSLKNVVLTDIQFTPEYIGMDEFNNHVNLSNNYYSIKNVQYYSMISNKLHQEMLKLNVPVQIKQRYEKMLIESKIVPTKLDHKSLDRWLKTYARGWAATIIQTGKIDTINIFCIEDDVMMTDVLDEVMQPVYGKFRTNDSEEYDEEMSDE